MNIFFMKLVQLVQSLGTTVDDELSVCIRSYRTKSANEIRVTIIQSSDAQSESQ